MNKFDRIVAILIQLQSKHIVKAQELSDRFEVSLRTIYRDIRSLETAGVPIYSEAGVGYSLMEGYRLPPVMFTKEEAISFIAAEKLMEQFTDEHLRSHYTSSMMKIKAVLKSADKELLTTLEEKVSVRTNRDAINTRIPFVLGLIFQSIAEKKKLFISYRSIEAGQPKERMVEPVITFYENGYWYFTAYCHYRKEYRHFRTDRLHEIHLTKDLFELAHEPEKFRMKTEDKRIKHPVLIRIEKDIAQYLAWERRFYGFIRENEGKEYVEMHFETPNIEGFARWLLMFADKTEIIYPEILRQQSIELMEAGLYRIKNKSAPESA